MHAHVRSVNILFTLRVLPDAASKHAVQAFFDCLRAEVEEYGISVSTINTTFISGSASSSSSSTEASRSIWSGEYTLRREF